MRAGTHCHLNNWYKKRRPRWPLLGYAVYTGYCVVVKEKKSKCEITWIICVLILFLSHINAWPSFLILVINFSHFIYFFPYRVLSVRHAMKSDAPLNVKGPLQDARSSMNYIIRLPIVQSFIQCKIYKSHRYFSHPPMIWKRWVNRKT